MPKTDTPTPAIQYRTAPEIHDMLNRALRERGELMAILEKAQKLRPALLFRDGVVPLCVLDYCNEARALLAKLKETP